MSARLVREALAARFDRKAIRVTMSYRAGGAREVWSAIDGERTAEAEVAGGAAVDVIVDELAQALSGRSPDGAERNPGLAESPEPSPHSASLHAGYRLTGSWHG